MARAIYLPKRWPTKSVKLRMQDSNLPRCVICSWATGGWMRHFGHFGRSFGTLYSLTYPWASASGIPRNLRCVLRHGDVCIEPFKHLVTWGLNIFGWIMGWISSSYTTKQMGGAVRPSSGFISSAKKAKFLFLKAIIRRLLLVSWRAGLPGTGDGELLGLNIGDPEIHCWIMMFAMKNLNVASS